MTPESARAFQQQFFEQPMRSESLFMLFDALPQTYFYAKNRRGQFVKVNSLFLENHGLEQEWQALGKTDRDFHPPLMAEAYMEEDRRIMESGRGLTGQVWLVLHRRRVPCWYVSNKIPLLTTSGEVIGIAGAMYRIEQQDELARYFQGLLPVVQHVEQYYAEPISMADMAVLAGISSTHFNRRFRQLLRMTPLHYLRAVRIQAAQRLLTTTSHSLAQVAAETGFTDQSHLTKRFREVTGMTPAEYRKRFVQSGTG